MALLALGLLLLWAHWQVGRPPTAQTDFAIFYHTARQPPDRMYDPAPDAARRGDVVLRNMNPPHFHLLVEPVAWLPLAVASRVWMAGGLLIAGACLLWIMRARGESWTVTDLAALALWAPSASMVSMNQVAFVLWPLLVFAWWAWRRDRWSLGAIGFGLALSVKPFLGLLGVWLLLRHQYRAAVVAAGVWVSVILIGLAIYGVTPYRDWLASLQAVAWPWAITNTSLAALLARSLGPSPMYTPLVLAPVWIRPLWMGLAVPVMLWTFWRVRTQGVDRAWLSVLSASLLVSPLAALYYGFWLLPGIRPRDVLRIAPLWAVPILTIGVGQPSGWATITWGSAYTWGLLLIWRHATAGESSATNSPKLIVASKSVSVRRKT